METEAYKLKLNLKQVLDLVAQLPEDQKQKLVKEILTVEQNSQLLLNEERIKNILRSIRPFLSHQLGKYTHQKSSKDWSFVGFAFTRKDLGYVFGANVGFFRQDKTNLFKYAGMNLLVRTNGGEEEARRKYQLFFREHLKNWINQDIHEFSYPARGDEGIELARYKKMSEFRNEQEIIDYIQEAILEFKKIYPAVVEHAGIFENVVRAAPKWNEKFTTLSKQNL